MTHSIRLTDSLKKSDQEITIYVLLLLSPPTEEKIPGYCHSYPWNIHFNLRINSQAVSHLTRIFRQ